MRFAERVLAIVAALLCRNNQHLPKIDFLNNWAFSSTYSRATTQIIADERFTWLSTTANQEHLSDMAVSHQSGFEDHDSDPDSKAVSMRAVLWRGVGLFKQSAVIYHAINARFRCNGGSPMNLLQIFRLCSHATARLAFVFFATMVFAQTPAQIAYDHNPAAGRFYDINGFKMYTEVYGSGPPLLMIHGNNGNMSAFAKNVPYFATHYKVILADSRSQGRSLDSDHPLTFEMMADDYAALLDAMHISSAYVIGWSDGGINALLLAIRHPEKVKRLASTGANLWPTADAFQPGLWDGEKKEYEAGLHKTYTTPQEKNNRKLFLLDWQEPHITLAQLHTIEAPSLIICGDHDLISVSHTVLIYQNIPHADLWVVPNSGHGTLIEHTDEFDQQVDKFFTGSYKDFN